MSLHRKLLIDGKEVQALSGRTTEDLNPYTGETYATVAAAGVEDVTRAADAAFATWSATSPFARHEILLNAADLLDSRARQAAEIMTAEVGAETAARRRPHIRLRIAGRWLEAHERWDYDDAARVQALRRLVGLYTDCHTATHFGLAELKGKAGAARAHLRTVTGLTDREITSHIEAAF